MKKIACLLTTLLFTLYCMAQNYHAVQGSSFAGSLGVANNPSSIVNTPFSWDLTVFGTQFKSSTNALTIYKYSYLSSPANSEYQFNNGNYARYAQFNFNANLFNTRIALSRKNTIAFGANLRSYTRIKTSPYNFMDTLKGARQFLAINDLTRSLSTNMTSSSWIELFGTYAQTIWDGPSSRLNAGVTLKVSRGLSGAYLRADNVHIESALVNNRPRYQLTSGTAQYGYSANFDQWQKGKGTQQNLRDFTAYTEGGFSMDAGIEYLIKDPVLPVFGEEDTYYDYTWKFGISLLDIGTNQYRHSNQSRYLSGLNNNAYDTLLDRRFEKIKDIRSFNDSLATIVNTSATLQGAFNIINPMRIVLNVDRYLTKDFYLNGELSLNLSPLAGNKRLYVQELNLLTITPRWETRKWGAYLPIQFNGQKQFWIGGAFKAGPLLLGIHNLANLVAKNKSQNGGGYLAFVIKPRHGVRTRYDKRLDCPPATR